MSEAKFTKEQIKEILTKAPAGATHYCSNEQYWRIDDAGKCWEVFEEHKALRAFFAEDPIYISEMHCLADLDLIINLTLELEKARGEHD